MAVEFCNYWEYVSSDKRLNIRAVVLDKAAVSRIRLSILCLLGLQHVHRGIRGRPVIHGLDSRMRRKLERISLMIG